MGAGQGVQVPLFDVVYANYYTPTAFARFLLTGMVFGVINEEAIAYLNHGVPISAEIPPTQPDNRAFVAVLPARRADAPAEKYRYLNSRYSMFELYEFHLIRMELRRGYEQYEDDYDCFVVSKDRAVARSQIELDNQMRQWLPAGIQLTFNGNTDCPL